MNNETILIVDDNCQLAKFIGETLLPKMGYKAKIAHDGINAMNALQSLRPALILLDFELPDTTGLEMLRELKNQNITIPTILFIDHGSEQIATDAFRLGVQDFLVKPVEPDELKAVIERALSEPRLRQEKAKLTVRLNEQVSWLNILSKIGQSLTSTLDPDEVLRRIVEAGVQMTQAEEGFLALLDNASGQLYLRAAKNIEEDQIMTMRIPVNDSLIGEVIHTAKAFRTTSVTSGGLVKVSTGYLVQSLLHVPILSKGHPLGVLSVDNRVNKRVFTQKDENMLVSLADYAAVALENANLYQQARHEILERKRIELALRESEQRYLLAIQGANDGIWDWDLKINKIYFSERWISMLGFNQKEFGDDPQAWFNLVHNDDLENLKLALSAHIRGLAPHFENEHRIRHRDGSYRWMHSRGLAVKNQDGVAGRIAGSMTDISERKAAEARLLHDAFFDRLTGLPNRALLMDRLKNAIERAKRREDYNFALLFLDLDQFKNVNDSLGHPAGDQLLITIGEMLKNNLRSTDTIARLGGDEFVILLEDIKNTASAEYICNLIHKRFSSPIRMAENEVFITTSIGIVLSGPEYNEPDDMLRDADIAMYEAKARGKGYHEIFKPRMRDRIIQRVSLESELRQAIEKEQLRVYYQPIISLKSGQLEGFEALARWQHSERGLIPPIEFIPIACETGLIATIDLWMIRESCRQIQEWQSRFHFDPPLKISVNLTHYLIEQPNLIETIKQILSETGLDNHCLRLEITENTVSTNSTRITNFIMELQNLNVDVQIDDFGTGYSSLTYLQKYPLSGLKIDQSFVVQMMEQGSHKEIVRTIVELAHDLGMQTFAEGIENKEQLNFLRSLGCDCGQGFLFSIPVDADTVSAILELKGSNEGQLNQWQELFMLNGLA